MESCFYLIWLRNVSVILLTIVDIEKYILLPYHTDVPGGTFKSVAVSVWWFESDIKQIIKKPG